MLERTVQLDVQGLVVHHPGEVRVLNRGVRTHDCTVQFNERSRT